MGGSPQPVPEISPVVSGITAGMSAAAPTTTTPTSTPPATTSAFSGTGTGGVVGGPSNPAQQIYNGQFKDWNAFTTAWASRTPEYQSKNWWENPSYTGPIPAEVLFNRPQQPIAPMVTQAKQPAVAAPIKQAFAPPMAPIAPQPIIDPGIETSLINPIQSSVTPAPRLNLPQGTVTGTSLGGAPPSIFAPQAGAGSRPWSSGFTPPAPYQPTSSQSGGGIGTTLGSGSPPPVSGKMSPTPMSTIGEVQKNQVPSTPNTGPNRGSPGAAASAIQYANQPVSSKNQVSPFAGEGLRFGGF